MDGPTTATATNAAPRAGATWVWTVTSDRVAYSAGWHALVGDPKGDTVESLHAWLGRVHPDDVAVVMRALDRHLRGDSDEFRCEHRLRASGGGFRWVVARGTAERNAAGQPVRLSGVLADDVARNRTDALAGLPGLFALRAHVDRLLAAARLTPTARFAVLLVDFDNIHGVNTAFGLEGGDALLADAFRRIARGLREGDLVARLEPHDAHATGALPLDAPSLPPLSGDECALAISNLTDVRDALRVASRLHDALAAPFPVAGQRLFASASIGIAMNSGAHDSVDDLLRDAYSALVRGRERGPAETQVFDDAAKASASEFMELADDLDAAVREGQIEMWYQPMVDLGTGAIVRTEALLRWRHPARGQLRPNVFVPLLDDTGMLVSLGWQTIGQACSALGEWRRATPRAADVRLSVNLSARQFLTADAVARLVRAVDAAGLTPADLEVELAELEVMTHYDQAVDVARAMREAGFHLALDDFGLGLATTEHIRALAVQTLKIDRSYLGGNPQRGGSVAVVQYAIELAAVLGIDVVAEGIETPTELQRLRVLSCPLGQGFLFSRAVPADEMLALLTRVPANGTDWWAGPAPATLRRRRDSDAAVTAEGR